MNNYQFKLYVIGLILSQIEFVTRISRTSNTFYLTQLKELEEALEYVKSFNPEYSEIDRV